MLICQFNSSISLYLYQGLSSMTFKDNYSRSIGAIFSLKLAYKTSTYVCHLSHHKTGKSSSKLYISEAKNIQQ